MYEGLNWQDMPVGVYGDSGDGAQATMDYNWMDWNQPGFDSSNFLRSMGYDQEGGGENFAMDEGALASYLQTKGLGLQQASLGNNTGYKSLYDLNTNKIYGTPTFYNNEDPMFQLGSSAVLSLANPAALGTALGATGGTASLLGGGLLGSAGSMLTGSDPLKGFALGGLGTFMPDVAGYAGINNTVAKNAINSGLKGGLSAAIQGGDIGANALLSGAVGGLNSLSGLFTPGAGEMPDVGTIGGEMNALDGESYAGSAGQPGTDLWNYWGNPTAPTTTDNRRTTQSENSGEGGSLFDSVSSLLFPTEGKGVFGSNLQFGDLAQGLAGLYSNYRQRRDAKEMLRGISGRRDAYSQNLQRSLQRRDAASGRRSDYAGRDVQLQASLAELDSRNAPAISQLNQQRQQGLAGMLAGALRMGGRAGILPIGKSNPMTYSLAQSGVPLGPQVTPDPNMYSLANGDPRLKRFGG